MEANLRWWPQPTGKLDKKHPEMGTNQVHGKFGAER